MRALLLVVGLYRAPHAWRASLGALQRANPSLRWETLLVTDQPPYCEHGGGRVVLVNASSFLERLRAAYALVDWSTYKQAVVLRPDVALTRAIDVLRLCAAERTTYIISGALARRRGGRDGWVDPRG